MDADTTTDWRGLAAVNLASDPSVPDLVHRSPSFLAIVRDAELVEAFLERWREAERKSSAELVVRFAHGRACVMFNTDKATAWLFENLPRVPGPVPELRPADNTLTMGADSGRQVVAAAEADKLGVFVVEA